MKCSLICFLAIVGSVSLALGANVLTVVMTTEPPRLDPAEVVSYEAGIITYNGYENLLKYNLETFEIEPSLATSWEVAEDGKSATFHLREGVKFHDGTPFDAEAVKYSLERTKAINRAPATYLAKITEAEVIDDHTIKLHASEAWAFWEDAFATRKALSIVSPTFVKAGAKGDDTWGAEYMYDHTCGTGPYVMKEWVHGQYVKVEKNPDYWGGWKEGQIDTAFVKVVREPAVEELMIKKGEADIAYDIAETHLEELGEDPNITVAIVGGMAQMYIPMKSHKGPLADVKVRKAISYAVNLDEFPKIYPGVVRGQGPIPRAMLGHDKTLPIYAYDPEVAKLLLADAGYKPGELKLKMVYLTGLEYQRRGALLVQQNLADIGVELELQEMTWSTLFPLLADPDKAPTMYFFYSAARFADPHGILYETFSPAALGEAGFNNGYNSADVGRLLDEAELTVDREKRAELYAEINRIIVQDAPAVFAFEMPYPFVFRSDLKGITPDRLFRSYLFYDITKQ
jgi:peptide/nickel transport system substrate-binding protein